MKIRLLVVAVVVAILALILFPLRGESTPQQDVPRPVESIERIVIDAALRHGVNAQEFLATAKCESSLRADAIGDNGDSLGVMQIHMPSHPEVTREQALNAYRNADWSAKKFKIDPTIWTCYRKLYE